MKRFFMSVLVLSMTSLLLTACNDNNGSSPTSSNTASTPVSSASVSVPNASAPITSASVSPGTNPGATPGASGNTATTTEKPITAGTINTLKDLYSAEHPLEIKKGSDAKIYRASNQLLYTIADMLTKSEEIDTASAEGKKLASSIVKSNSDYSLQFDGAKLLLVNVKENTAYFDGESTIYKFWGDSKNLWENIKWDTSKSSADISEKGLECQESSYMQDITGDNTPEKISLIYKVGKNMDFRGDLILRVNDKAESVVITQTEWQIFPQRTINESPTIKTMGQKSSKNKILFVTLSWLSTSNGSTADIYAYLYKDSKLTNLDLYAPETLFSYESGDSVKISFPQVNSSQTVKFNSKSYETLVEKGKTLKSLITDKANLSNIPQFFKIDDFNGDGDLELCSMSTLMFESLGRMSFGVEYTFYKSANDGLKPVKVLLAPPYIEDLDVKLERYLYGLLFDYNYFTVNEKGAIVSSWYKASTDYKESEIINKINKLISSKHLVKKGNNVYVNIP